jgi:hypothetical protein
MLINEVFQHQENAMGAKQNNLFRNYRTICAAFFFICITDDSAGLKIKVEVKNK